MRITRLQLRNVRRHADLDLALAPGLTVVRGPNESGKSTIQRAIELALTRRVTSGSADLDGMRSWNSSDDDRPVGAARVRAGGPRRRPRPARSRRPSAAPRGTVKLELDGETITDPARADEVLADLTGIPSEPFFRSTASVRHHELDGLARDEAALRDRLQASISRRGPRHAAARGGSSRRRSTTSTRRATRTRARSRPPRQASPPRPPPSATARRPSRSWSGIATRSPRPARIARSTEADLAEQRSLLEKARLAERLIAEREQARGALRALQQRRRRQHADRRPRGTPPVVERAARAPRGPRPRSAPRTCGSARSRPRSRARSRSSSS